MFPSFISAKSTRLCSLLHGAVLFGLFFVTHSLAQTPAATNPPPPMPADLDGQWWGAARHGDETGEIGFEFSRRPNDRLLAKEWLPNANAYGTPIGWVAYQDGKYSVPGANMPLTLKDGVLTGSLWLPDFVIRLRRTDQALLYALDADTGKKRWTVYHWLSWVESTPVLVDGLLYIGSSDSRRVRVIEPDTGKVRWSAQVWGWTWGTPLVVGDTVYYGTAGAGQYFVTQKPSLGGLKRENGDHFRATLLSRGGSEEALTLFRNFTGRDPYLEPLLKRRGLEQTTNK